MQVLKALPLSAHPMALLRTGVSAYGCTDENESHISTDNFKHAGARLVAQAGTMVAALWRLAQGQEPITPDPSLSYAANLLYMLKGEKPNVDEAKIMDQALICHADHGIPASTFTAMVTVSSLTDLYSAVSAAIGYLKGTFHGGAME